jgi:cell division protein FtsQ
MTGAALPIDVRLMNAVSGAVFALAGITLLAAAVLWLARSSAFPVRAIRLEGDLARNSVSTVRANALPALQGNFYSLDLKRARAAFESVPWVRHAVVRRVWPDRLAVRLEEHRPVALWQGEDGNERLVNSFGEVFEANVGDVEDDGLPELAGPDGASAEMLAMLQRLQPVFAGMRREVVRLSLSGRGSWRAELDGETVVELGRGGPDEVVARTGRFARTLAQVTGHFRSPLLAADLRHPEGYAVRLRGVTTTTAPAAPGSH